MDAVWKVGFVGVIVPAVAFVLPRDTGNLLVLGWSALCVISVGIAATRLHSKARTFFALLCLTGVLMISGAVTRSIHGASIGVDQPFPSPADLFHIPAYALFAFVIFKIHRIRALRRDIDAWLDSIALTGAGLLLFWAAFLADFVTSSSQSPSSIALSTFYNAMVFGAAALLIRMGASPGRRPMSYTLLAVTSLAFVIADIAGAVSDANGATVYVTVAFGPIAYGLAAAASWHPSAQEIATAPQPNEESIGRFRMAMTAIAIAVPALITLFPAARVGVGRAGTGALSVVIAVALVLRVGRLLRRQRRTTDLETRLSNQLGLLTGLTSPTELPGSLRSSVRSIFDGDATLSWTSDPDEAGVVHAPQALAEAIGKPCAVLRPLSDDPVRHRIFQSFIRDSDAILTSLIAVESEAKQRSQAEATRKIAANEKRFRALVQNSSDIVAVLHPKSGEITYMSESVERILGYTADQFLGKTLEWVAHENDWDFARDYLEATLEGTELDDEHELRIQHQDGSMRLLEATLTDMRSVEGIHGVVANASDVTEKRALERDLRDAETIDPLTMLLNRNAFIREADAAIRRASVRDSSVAMAIVNIDGFRLINEAYGTPLADEVLIELARRVRQTVRTEDSVARLNGDEFGVLMPDGDSTTEAEAMVERVLEELREPVAIAGRSVALSATAGLVNDIDLDSTAIELLRDADTALDAAKQTNRGGVLHFDEAMGEEVTAKVEVRNRLRDAIEDGTLRLNFQPIVDMERGHIVSLEALARWHDDERGEISPSVFIPIAESSGMISKLGEWALRTACEHVSTWGDMGLHDFTVSVNMSGHQLREENVIARMRRILEETRVDPTRITIEITESVLIDDTDFIADRIRALRELGLRLSIDDFGTGYSSLSYLRRYDFDVLKIDRSFVIPLANDKNKREREIVNAMIKLAQALGAVTVAEGIEENEEYAVLRTLGCDYAQGFLFYRPQEAERIPAVLRGQTKRAAA